MTCAVGSSRRPSATADGRATRSTASVTSFGQGRNASPRASRPDWKPHSQPTPAQGRRLAETLIESLPSSPIAEIARLGRTLRRWKTAFLAYFDTDGARNGGTEAINGIIELGRRIARGFRNFEHYRLRMLLITDGLDASPHTHL